MVFAKIFQIHLTLQLLVFNLEQTQMHYIIKHAARWKETLLEALVGFAIAPNGAFTDCDA
jgi:hypothetical protein